MAVQPHVHINAVGLLASTAAVIAVFGTLHLLALSNSGDENGITARLSRAFIALGF